MFKYHQIIEYTACDQSIFQQDVIVHRIEGVAYEEQSEIANIWHMYVGNRCRVDYGDIRFADTNGRELAYYLWPDFTDGSARFTVRIDDANVPGMIYLLYGNIGLTTTSNGESTFLVYDNFDAGLSDNWEIVSGSPVIVNGRLRTQGIFTLTWKVPVMVSAICITYPSTHIMNTDTDGGYSTYWISFGGSKICFYPDGSYDRYLRSTSNNDGWWNGTNKGILPYQLQRDQIIVMPNKIGHKKNQTPIEWRSWVSLLSPSSRIGIGRKYSGTSHGVVDIDNFMVRAYSESPPSAINFLGEQINLVGRDGTGSSVSFGSSSITII